MMRRLFTLLSMIICCITISGCEKEFDPSKVEFEVSIVLTSSSDMYQDQYSYNCYGSLGGFIGNATIVIDDRRTYNVNVTGAKTPYSFIFGAGSKLSHSKPSSFNVKVFVGEKNVMETIVVPR